jgi:hypothetical protein
MVPLRQGFFCLRLQSHIRMDSDLESVIRQALETAERLAGRHSHEKEARTARAYRLTVGVSCGRQQA